MAGEPATHTGSAEPSRHAALARILADGPMILSRGVGDARIAETRRAADQQGDATLGLDYELTDDDLEIRIVLTCAIPHMAVPYDLIAVTLECATTELDVIATLAVSQGGDNMCVLTARYPFTLLARMLGAGSLPSPDALEFLRATHPQVAVKVKWLTSSTDGRIHRRGGMSQRGGNGVIALRALSGEELAAAESQRRTEWNLGENLGPGRRVYDEFPDVLQRRQMSTTIEAELEYLVEEEDFDTALRAMEELAATPSRWSALGLSRIQRNPPRVFRDTYYDVESDRLFAAGVALRHRSVADDPAGTCLFSIKGRYRRSARFPERRLRLVGDVQLKAGALEPDARGRLAQFLADGGVDNPFARILRDSLGRDFGSRPDKIGPESPLARSVEVRPVLVVESVRRGFLVDIASGPSVVVSLDVSSAAPDPSAVLRTIEFGVGHPGLTVPAPAAAGGASPADGPPRPDLPSTQAVRPYHVPEDLANGELFEQPDYLNLMRLRDSLLAETLGRTARDLPEGGNRAVLLRRPVGARAAGEA
jgi:hypothetical protein